MRYFKGVSLAVVASLASMAFLGASPASANQSTTLCKINQLPCASGNQWPKGTKLRGVSVGKVLLLTDIVTVHCPSTATGEITSAALANPLIGTLVPSFGHCLTGGGTLCTVTSSSGTMLLLKTGPNVGVATVHNVLVSIDCGIFMDCSYTSKGVQLQAKSLSGAFAARLHADEVELETEEGGFLCPDESFWDALYEVKTSTGAGVHISS